MKFTDTLVEFSCEVFSVCTFVRLFIRRSYYVSHASLPI